MFNRLVIEYERPGVLAERLDHGGTRHAVGQLQCYLEVLAQQGRHESDRMAGVALDGRYLVFARYRAGSFTREPPVRVTEGSLEKLALTSGSKPVGPAEES